MKSSILFILLCIAGNLFSQSSKEETFSSINANERVKPFERKYIQYSESSDGTISFNSLLTRKLEVFNYNGHDRYLVTQTYCMEKVCDRDSSICEFNTLMPVAYFSNVKSEGTRESVIFSENGINNTVYFGDSSKSVNKQGQGRYNGVIETEIISAMPLQLNKKFVYKTVNPGKRYFEYTTRVFVTGKENIDIPGLGSIPCWKVHISQGSSNSISWYSIKGHIQVKQKYNSKDGSSFNRVLIIGA